MLNAMVSLQTRMVFGSYGNDIDEDVIYLAKSNFSRKTHPWNSLALLVNIGVYQIDPPTAYFDPPSA